MRLINSDGTIVDAKVDAGQKGNANRNEASVRFDMGAFVLAAALSVMLVTVAVSVYALGEARGARDLGDLRYQTLTAQQQRLEDVEKIRTTEDRVQINHTMEMEATQRNLVAEVEGLKHGKR